MKALWHRLMVWWIKALAPILIDEEVAKAEQAPPKLTIVRKYGKRDR